MSNIKIILLLAGLIALLAIPMAAIGRSENSQGQNSPKNSSSVAVITSASASADNDLNHGAKNWKDKLTEFKAAKEAEKITRLKELGAMLIENRISLLNKLKTRIQENEKISADVKTQTIADIDTNIADLNTLKTKIAADTDLATLKADIKSIFEKFRIYMVAAPKGLGESLASQGQYILGRLEAIQRQLQTMLEQNKNAGKDISSLQSLIDQITAKLIDAKAQLAIAEEKFKAMTPANTDAAKTAREEGKAAMKQAKQDLKDAYNLLKQISDALKLMSSASPASSPAALTSPTISPSVSPSIVPSPSAS